MEGKTEGESSDERARVLELEPFKTEEYGGMDLDRLGLVAVNMLIEKEVEPTYDNIVVACFKLFPKKFSLPNYQEFPDGKRVHDALFHMYHKSKKWLAGNPKSGYAITEKGKHHLEEAFKRLGMPERQTGKGEVHRKELHFVMETKNSEAYKKWTSGGKEDIKRWEVLQALKATSEDTAKRNVESRTKYAEIFGEEDVISFLKFCKEFLEVTKNDF